MNKKHKVLTILALIAFVMIGACHYLQWPPISLFRMAWIPSIEWEEHSWKEVKPWQDDAHHYEHVRYDGYPEHPEIYFTDENPSDDAKAWVPVRRWYGRDVSSPRINVTQDRNDMMIADVRMPWFMLGVIYVGLFFLLADRKEVRP